MLSRISQIDKNEFMQDLTEESRFQAQVSRIVADYPRLTVADAFSQLDHIVQE
jgi:hypothetical protein